MITKQSNNAPTDFYGKEALGDYMIQLELVPSYEWLVYATTDNYTSLLQLGAKSDKSAVWVRLNHNNPILTNQSEKLSGLDVFGIINGNLSNGSIDSYKVDKTSRTVTFNINN